jgi:hypothetical protein
MRRRTSCLRQSLKFERLFFWGPCHEHLMERSTLTNRVPPASEPRTCCAGKATIASSGPPKRNCLTKVSLTEDSHWTPWLGAFDSGRAVAWVCAILPQMTAYATGVSERNVTEYLDLSEMHRHRDCSTVFVIEGQSSGSNEMEHSTGCWCRCQNRKQFPFPQCDTPICKGSSADA